MERVVWGGRTQINSRITWALVEQYGDRTGQDGTGGGEGLSPADKSEKLGLAFSIGP